MKRIIFTTALLTFQLGQAQAQTQASKVQTPKDIKSDFQKSKAKAETLKISQLTKEKLKAIVSRGNEGGGGGNGINGLPLESYAVDVTTLPEFKQFVEPILEKINAVIPQAGELAQQVLTDKTWYMVPVELDEISPETIGTVFSSDQLARQSIDSVWMSQLKVSQMPPQGYARLIFHEILLGMIQYEIKKNSEAKYFFNPSINSEINYEQIRRIGIKLFQNYKTMNELEIQSLFEVNGFPRYSLKAIPTTFTPKELYKYLREVSAAGGQMEYCRFEKIKLNENGSLSLSLSRVYPTESYQLDINATSRISYQSPNGTNIGYEFKEQPENLKVGDKFKVFWLEIYDRKLSNVEYRTYEAVLDEDGALVGKALNGFNCADFSISYIR